jgi:hypothetical protein
MSLPILSSHYTIVSGVLYLGFFAPYPAIGLALEVG